MLASRLPGDRGSARRSKGGAASGGGVRGTAEVVLHELSIAHEIYRTARAAVAEHGAGRIETVRVAVGELSAVEPELLAFAWEATVANGPDGGARLEIDWHPARQRCAACGEDKRQAAASWLRLCPECGGPLEVTGGDELDVLQVTFLQPEEEGSARHG